MKRAWTALKSAAVFVAGLVLCWGPGCAGASTDILPSTSRVTSKVKEKLPTTTERSSITIETAPAPPPPEYRIRVIIKEPPCAPPAPSTPPASSSSSSPSPGTSSPSPKSP